jgi:CRP-like cAMP-binding protein
MEWWPAKQRHSRSAYDSVPAMDNMTSNGRVRAFLDADVKRLVGLMDGLTVRLPITQEQIGDAIGLSPVHVSRVFKEIRLKGLIRTEGRTLIVTDWAGLIEIGEFDPAYLHLRSEPRGHRTRR